MKDIKQILNDILNFLSDDFSIEEKELAGQKVLHINSQDAKLLIGKNGNNLRSIDYLLGKIAQKLELSEKFIVDVNEYKSKEIKEIEEKARLLANRAKTLQYDVEMPPMTAYERLIVHSALADDPQIKTESHGEGKDRKLVIKFIG